MIIFVNSNKFILIERLVEAIANSILQQSEHISQVQVILSKINAPIPDFGGTVSIDVTRSRSLYAVNQ